MKKLTRIYCILILVIIAAGEDNVLQSEEITPKEILRLADQSRGNLEGIKWNLSIESIENNEKQERDFNVSARGYDFLAVSVKPAKVKGQKILMVDHNMWFAKPGIKKPVPISSRQKLVGGAAYGDIAATNYADDYEPFPLPDDTVNGELCYVFDLKAVSKKATYDQIIYWISKSRNVGVKAEYYTVSGKLFKTAFIEYNNRTSKDNPAPFISKMTISDSLVKGNVTSLIFLDNELTPIPDSKFDLNFLMNQ